MDKWEKALREIEDSKIEISKALEEFQYTSTSNDTENNIKPNIIKQAPIKIETLKKFLKIKNSETKNSRIIPFLIEGGIGNGELIFVGAILDSNLLEKLHIGDVILSANNIYISGRMLSEVSAYIYNLFYTLNEIDFEYIPSGQIPINVREILRDKVWQELQPIVRENIFLRTMPCTNRPPNPEEINGKNYFFVSTECFLYLIDIGIFLEVGKYKGYLYGTPKPEENVNSFNFLEDINLQKMVADSKGPLPPNWEIAYSETGEKYFIDHNSGSTQWEDPRDLFEALPHGWERVEDETHGTFYVDHINKVTQFARPNMNPQPSISNVYSISASDSNGFYSSKAHLNYSNHVEERAVDASINNVPSKHFNGSTNNYDLTSDTAAIWQKNGLNKATNEASSSSSTSNASNNQYKSNGINESSRFTRDPKQLKGQILNTRIQKGDKGLGFTLIGNDGNNLESEFIQIKSVIPNGPAAKNGVVEPGDVLVFVNNECMLGASQDDACRVFRSIPVGEFVNIQICRGYTLFLDPSNRIITENVYASTNFQARAKENFEIEMCKGPKGFGFTITDSLQGQRVKSVLYPDQCPNLLEGDVILEVDGHNVRSAPHSQLVQMLQEYKIGQKSRMLISRNVARHRSRTPTAGFRYGEQRNGNVNHAAHFTSRSKTPAPATNNNKGIYSTRQPINSNQNNWNTTVPRSSNNNNGNTFLTSTLNHRPASTSLGFSNTPNYMPLSAFGVGQNEMMAGTQLVVVNLIHKKEGFGFRLLGGRETGTPLTVGAIIQGGPAHLDGRLKERDEIVEIDGKPIENGSHDMAVELVKKAATMGHVKLVVKRYREDIPHQASLSYANNSYDYQDKNELLPYDVHLAKLDHEEFGCTIISQNHRFIGKIIPNSPADRCGRLRAGDCLLALNNLPVYNMTHQQVVNYIKSSGNAITFTIDPAQRMLSNYEEPQLIGTLKKKNENIIYAHSSINNGTLKSNHPVENPHFDSVDSNLITVELTRGAKGFGFSIRGGWEFNEMPLLILRIAEDGAAALDGRLRVGDQLIEINNENTTRMTHERAIQIIKENPNVRLLIKRTNVN